MSRGYIYREHPVTRELLTLGRLTLQGKVGEFIYAPDYVARGGWVPDPVNYPLRAEAYTGVSKNRGIPGFINDAMPDGWVERLLHRVYGQDLAPIDFLLKSPNNDRILQAHVLQRFGGKQRRPSSQPRNHLAGWTMASIADVRRVAGLG
ncbi:HipA N-terminal domain-containing protein [Pseudomonas sp. MH10]|uniref:HipA N-terminal domain-containing protein n=1 Tax=Pseudomonas sp. MH10 TaxID=3048627 RepID=UPI002B3D5691|nr:HipA N-terminal domain-containing protein [Pseudomonas sp. MH10]